MNGQNPGTVTPGWVVDQTYGAMGFSPEDREESFVHKHRVLAHEAVMRIDVVGTMGAWRVVRAYARALLPKAGDPFVTLYRASAEAFVMHAKKGWDPKRVISSLLEHADLEGMSQGRFGRRDSSLSREDVGTGIVVGMGRLKPERLKLDQTIVYDEESGRILISDSVSLDESPRTPSDEETPLDVLRRETEEKLRRAEAESLDAPEEVVESEVVEDEDDRLDDLDAALGGRA